MFRGDAGKDDLPLHGLFKFLIAHVFQFTAGYHAQVFTLHDAYPPGDAFCRKTIIPGNHNDADASAAAFLNRFGYIGSRRVHHRNHAKKGQVGFNALNLVFTEFARENTRGSGQDAQPLAGIGVIPSHDEINPFRADGNYLIVHPDGGTGIQNLTDAAFNVSHALEVSIHALQVNNAHAFTPRVEGQFRDVLVALKVVTGITGLIRQDQQSGFGWVAQNFPAGFCAVRACFGREQPGGVAFRLGQNDLT